MSLFMAPYCNVNKPFSIQYVRVKLYNYIHRFGICCKSGTIYNQVQLYIRKFSHSQIHYGLTRDNFATLAYQFQNQKLKASKMVEYRLVG